MFYKHLLLNTEFRFHVESQNIDVWKYCGLQTDYTLRCLKYICLYLQA